MAKRVGITVAIIVGVIVVIVGAYLAYVMLSYHRLEDSLELAIDPPLARSSEETSAPTSSRDELTTSTPSLTTETEYTVVSANLGFGAYNPDFDFFMDGGSGSVAESPEVVTADINGSAEALKALNPNFLLFQEVDVDGTRSHHIDEYALLRAQFPDDWSIFCENYDSPYLAWPLYAPHGANRAGLVTFSDVPLTSSLRRSLPISESLSKFLDLDRCYDVTRVPAGDHDLVLINVHLSAYGADAEIMASQRAKLYEDMVAARNAGDYVIAGGDYNHDMIGVSGEVYGNATQAVESWAKPYDFGGVPAGFTVASRAKLEAVGEEHFTDAATCRDAGRPYDGTNDRWIMDTFIYSDNVESVAYETVDLDFAYSDHNPVLLRFRLH